jgi:hypothetical protein
MRSAFENTPEVFCVKVLAFVLGVAFIMGAMVALVSGDAFRGAVLFLFGCYITAASALGLIRGADADRVFAPAGVGAFAGLFALAAAGGVFAS